MFLCGVLTDSLIDQALSPARGTPPAPDFNPPEGPAATVARGPLVSGLVLCRKLQRLHRIGERPVAACPLDSWPSPWCRMRQRAGQDSGVISWLQGASSKRCAANHSQSVGITGVIPRCWPHKSRHKLCITHSAGAAAPILLKNRECPPRGVASPHVCRSCCIRHSDEPFF
jgi:hypothetical protein